jgi:hypothetical protein
MEHESEIALEAQLTQLSSEVNHNELWCEKLKEHTLKYSFAKYRRMSAEMGCNDKSQW